MAQAGLFKWAVIGVGAWLLLRPKAEEEAPEVPREVAGGPLGIPEIPPGGMLDYQRYAPQYKPRYEPMYRQRFPSS